MPHAAASNAFALELFTALAPGPHNFTICPASVRATLALAYAGADDETAAELRDVLGLPEDVDRALAETAALVVGARDRTAERVRPSIASSIWIDAGFAVREEYFDRVRRVAAGEIHRASLSLHPGQSAAAINTWVAECTAGVIRELLTPDKIGALSRVLLVSAVYFEGRWQRRFRGGKLSIMEFRRATGDAAFARFMHRTDTMPLIRMNGALGVDLAYRDSSWSMAVLLPDEELGLTRFVETLAERDPAAACAAAAPTEVVLDLPRFTVDSHAELVKPLRHLGIRRAFEQEEAQFPGINGETARSPDALYVQDVVHQAFVEVDENGTRAGAATVAGMAVKGIPDGLRLRFDRPFVFMIHDRESGAILFLGQVCDPPALH